MLQALTTELEALQRQAADLLKSNDGAATEANRIKAEAAECRQQVDLQKLLADATTANETKSQASNAGKPYCMYA